MNITTLKATGRAVFTCPINLRIREPVLNSCPICDMAREPVVIITEDTGPSPAWKDDEPVHLRLACAGFARDLAGDGRAFHFPSAPYLASRHIWLNSVCSRHKGMPRADWPSFARNWTALRSLALNILTMSAIETGIAWLCYTFASAAPYRLYYLHLYSSLQQHTAVSVCRPVMRTYERSRASLVTNLTTASMLN